MGVAAGPLSRDRRVAALLGALAGTSPVALAEPDLESRDLPIRHWPRFRPLMTRMYGPAVRCKRVEIEMEIVRYRQLVDRTSDEELLRRIRTQIAELEQKPERSTSKAALIAPGR